MKERLKTLIVAKLKKLKIGSRENKIKTRPWLLLRQRFLGVSVINILKKIPMIQKMMTSKMNN